jgi:flavoprotein
MTALRALAVLAVGLLAAACSDTVPTRRAIADLARSACRGVGSCTVVCDDGSTLDGRPVTARCRP